MALKTQRDEIRLIMKEDTPDETVVCVGDKKKLIDEDSKEKVLEETQAATNDKDHTVVILEEPLEDSCEDWKYDCQESVRDCGGCVLQGVKKVLFVMTLPLAIFILCSLVVLIVSGGLIFPVMFVGELTGSSALQFVTFIFCVPLALLMLSPLIVLVGYIG